EGHALLYSLKRSSPRGGGAAVIVIASDGLCGHWPPLSSRIQVAPIQPFSSFATPSARRGRLRDGLRSVRSNGPKPLMLGGSGPGLGVFDEMPESKAPSVFIPATACYYVPV
ncbi:unnamed protein product, partial [Urochloa humidicola]